MKKIIITLMMCLLVLPAMAQKSGTFTTGDKTFMLNGEPFIVKAAEIHYPRIPQPYWEHRIKMCKALGMNAVCIYIFWNIDTRYFNKFRIDSCILAVYFITARTIDVNAFTYKGFNSISILTIFNLLKFKYIFGIFFLHIF